MDKIYFFLLDASDHEDSACVQDPLQQLYIQHQDKLKAAQVATDREDQAVTGTMGLEKVELLASGRRRVLRCRKTKDGDSPTEVAVKITSIHQDYDVNEKFDKEVYLLKKFGDLCVAKFVQAMSFPALGLTALVTEFYSGGNLVDALSSGRLSAQFQLSTVAFTLIDTVDDIHRRDIVNRDVCPENILISSSGIAVLSGFSNVFVL